MGIVCEGSETKFYIYLLLLQLSIYHSYLEVECLDALTHRRGHACFALKITEVIKLVSLVFCGFH